MIWSQFPPEIRHTILEALTEDKNCRLSNAALVSREWQAVIEPHIFAYIRVTPKRIAQLNAMTQRNRDHVRYIWFCIELEQYDCRKCDSISSIAVQTSHSDNKLILASFQSLFTALNTWEPNRSLTLDISLYSKSDNEHAFKYLTFMPDTAGHQVEPMSMAESDEPDKHQWETTALGSIPPKASLDRLFGHVWPLIKDERKCWAQAPKVPAVTRLEMRLQTYRRWDASTISQILSHLPGLREFHYEMWMQWIAEMHETWQHSMLHLLAATEGLSKLTIFENSNQHYPLYFIGEASPARAPTMQLSQKLARVNLGVEVLSVSFMVDAADHLTLTSQLLAPTTCPTQMMDLLQAAASAARYMPKLKMMEICYGREGLATLFKYEFIPGHLRQSVVTWRATWCMSIQPRVIEAWEGVVSRRRGCPSGIDVVYETVNEHVTSIADAIVSLKLSETVLRPISLQQIRREQSFVGSLTA
ncbi:hypothetical protein BBK36DRAFT_1172722 [Trichoderma citrinoviride]|uniref:DUF6546 domain-containing protein n=1 Tax=Trichoderma citrinoviride TaxID=58853 RepID=A0A2T4AYL3_9HYPO|nr:hypothetical protein BBK36DRAFT_1172722 [Trichoderma citrinoviride]PTB62163.1 hypothetical protein BBK36DRAFT_1172722 [Trichoderma citrinoviride]